MRDSDGSRDGRDGAAGSTLLGDSAGRAAASPRLNPSDRLDRLAAEVALTVVRRQGENHFRKRLIDDFAARVWALTILDESVLEQIAEGTVPESPPSPMPRGSEMMLKERGRR